MTLEEEGVSGKVPRPQEEEEQDSLPHLSLGEDLFAPMSVPGGREVHKDSIHGIQAYKYSYGYNTQIHTLHTGIQSLI